MINKKNAKDNNIKQKAEELIKNLIKNNKENFGTKFEPIYKEVHDKTITNSKQKTSIPKVSQGKKELIIYSKKGFQLKEDIKRKSNFEKFQNKVESSHDKIVRKMPQIKENDILIQSLINNTNNTLNADLKSSSLGKSILDYSNNRKIIKSVGSKSKKHTDIQYSESIIKERKCSSKIVFNSVIQDISKDNNRSKLKRRKDKLSKILEENVNINIFKKVNSSIINNQPSTRKPIYSIEQTQLKNNCFNYYYDTSTNKHTSNDYYQKNEKILTDDVKLDVETNDSLSKQNIIFEDNIPFTNPNEDKSKEISSKIFNKFNYDLLDSSLNSIKNDLKNMNNDLINFKLKNQNSNDNQGNNKDKLDSEVQNSIRILIDSPLNQNINLFPKEKDIILIKDQEISDKFEIKGNLDNYQLNTFDSEEDIEEFKFDENINQVYSSDTKTIQYPELKSNLMNSIKLDEDIDRISIPIIEEETNEIKSVIRKYLFDTTAMNSKYDLNESRASLEKDITTIIARKKWFENIKKIYTLKIQKVTNELNELRNINGSKLDKYKTEKEIEIEKLLNKLNEVKANNITSSFTQSINQNSNDNSIDHEKIKTYREKYMDIKASVNLIENNYKNVIKQLFNEIQANKIANPSLVLDRSLMKELNEILNDNQINIDSSRHNKLLASISSVETNNNVNKNLEEIKENIEDSMIKELDNFKREDLSNFKFEIPTKYQLGKNIKVLKENLRKDGTLLKYYENSVLEVVYKNNTINRVFPDGLSITFYSNKDIKQNYHDGRVIYYFAKNKSLEFNFPKHRYTVYKFKNNQLEKHFYDGKKYIRFSDGSYKIIRPNGEELNEFNDGQIQRKNKLGQITFTTKSFIV